MRFQQGIYFTGILLLASAAYAQGADPAAETGPAWSPYLVGGLIGVLIMFTFYFSDKPIGASGAYSKTAGLLGKGIAPKHTESLKHYRDSPPKVDWEVAFVGFIILGSFLAAWSGGEITGRAVPPMWAERFGDSILLRIVIAFLGGILLSIGARMAGGCTSGHGISGTLQLSVGSWIAVCFFFIGGVITAMLLYRL